MSNDCGDLAGLITIWTNFVTSVMFVSFEEKKACFKMRCKLLN